MTHPDDLVERVAKAIYNAGPVYEIDHGFAVVSWEALIESEGDYCPISSACRDKARAALTEAGAWIVEARLVDEGAQAGQSMDGALRVALKNSRTEFFDYRPKE